MSISLSLSFSLSLSVSRTVTFTVCIYEKIRFLLYITKQRCGPSLAVQMRT